MDDNDLHASGQSAAPAPCEVMVTSDSPHWSEHLREHPDATVYHDPRWGEVMARAYGNAPFYLTARRGGAIVGTLQLVHQKSLMFGSHLCSLPYFDAAGVLADDRESRDALIDAAGSLMLRRRAEWVELRQSASLGESLPARTDKVTLQLPLSAEPDELWKALKAKVRNQVRKATRAGLVCVRGGGELLDEFYPIYVRNMRDLGSPPHSRRFFAVLAETFAESVALFVVRQGARTLAASFTLMDRQAFRVPWAASDWRVRDLCANMLLYWEMLADACRRGAGVFDFGRSTRDAGTYRFKKQWGAEEVPLYWHFLLPEGRAIPELRPDSPKYRLMTACWRKLPLCLARALGPRIIAKLS